MRFRIRFFAFLLVFLIFLPIFCIFLGDFLSRNEVAIFGEDYEFPVGKVTEKPEKREDSGIISKSVLLGYSNADKLSIFSAYTTNGKTTVILSSYGYLNRRVYCRLFDEQKREISANPVSVFPEFTVKCSASSSGGNARFVAVTVNKKDVPANLHRIISAENRNISEFSVCLAPLFGETPKVLMLMEFIEYYTLQGADNFLIYSFDISSETRKLLDFYQNRIKMEVIPMGNSTKCLNRHRCRHEMQLQDCIFRTQSHSKWVATVDLDERIMPINEDSRIIDFLKSEPSKTGELRFRCQWTLRYLEIPPGPPKIDNLPMIKWHNTSHVAPQNHTTKSIIRPLLVDSMGVHGVQKFAKTDFLGEVRLVEPEQAVVRHYRLIRGWSFFLKEAESFGDFFDFRISGKLSGLILQRVSEIIKVFPVFAGEN